MKKKLAFILVGFILIFAGVFGVSRQFSPQLYDFFHPVRSVPLQENLGFSPYLVEVNENAVAPTLQPTLQGTPFTGGRAEAAAPEKPEEIYIGKPDRIVIEAIGLDAPVVESKTSEVSIGSEKFLQWKAPDELAAGWHTDSAMLGAGGNTVLNGHHNVYGEVFKQLVDLKSGDVIQLYSGEHRFDYWVTNSMILTERFATLEKRLQNAAWIAPSPDTRLTLITCWPYDSNTHRLIIVAQPVPSQP